MCGNNAILCENINLIDYSKQANIGHYVTKIIHKVFSVDIEVERHILNNCNLKHISNVYNIKNIIYAVTSTIWVTGL